MIFRMFQIMTELSLEVKLAHHHFRVPSSDVFEIAFLSVKCNSKAFSIAQKSNR